MNAPIAPPAEAEARAGKPELSSVREAVRRPSRPAPDPWREWTARAVAILDEEARGAGTAPLIRVEGHRFGEIDLYIKDESAHPSGSLKHRLARSLFLLGICNGDIGPDTTIVEASSGSTAISLAWFARLLGLSFVAFVPRGTAPAKIEAIRAEGGSIHLVEPGEDGGAIAADFAASCNGHFMDQFSQAERATDWRGNNNIAESLFGRMRDERHPVPAWIVVGAGTGGTSTTIGRYIRYRPDLAATRLCVVDPEGSAFFAGYEQGDPDARGRCSPVVEGIGRPRVEPSFRPRLIDAMISLPDAASVAGTAWLEARTGRRWGPSTGTNIVGALMIARSLYDLKTPGSIVTLACDEGARYANTIYDEAWVAQAGLDIAPWRECLTSL